MTHTSSYFFSAHETVYCPTYPCQRCVQQKPSTGGIFTDLSPGSESWTQIPASLGLSNVFSSFLFPPSLCLYEGFTKRLGFFFEQAIAIVTNISFSGVKYKWIRNMWLKFPTKLNSYGLRYKRENSVFQNMVWIFINSKCWENSLGIHLTFNYGQNHSSLMLPNFILLKNVSFSGKTTYIAIKHPHSQVVKSSNRIRWERNTKYPVRVAEENASYHWMCTCIIWGSCENEIWFSRSQVGPEILLCL